MLRHLLADHAAGAGPAAGLRAAGPADGPPAGPAGARGGQPQRGDEHPDDRAVLRSRRDPGQAVRPAERESAEFGARAARVRDIGVRTAMVQSVFVTALTLVSALALALVYGLGGYFALTGALDAGAVVTLALLLTRLYAPLTALASARVEVMSALVSFERVFEVLDLKPLITEKPDPRSRARRSGRDRVRRRGLRLPGGGQGVAGLAGGGRRAGHPRRRRGAPRRLVPRRARADGGAGRVVRSREVHHRLSCCARLYDVDSGAVRIGGRRRAGPDASPRSGETLGLVTQDGHLFHESDPGQPAAGQPEPRPTTSCGTRCAGPAWTTWSPRCPTGWTPWSGSAATGCPAGSGSG